MLNIEIDGKATQVAPGSTVMDAANQVGAYIPHFCYHKKLSIAANCRMCLVEVEKAPKPLPACATPVTEGMKVHTASTLAKRAQEGMMEFLLINHPLDCPICDQGGECQLQDLSVGYGNSGSRFVEEKRVVFHKDLGPLISAEEMTRCIHCTRCIRFGQEIAGVMELGMGGRGEHSEILTFVGSTVDSELSGNMIDICPVGALTSKPFRYSARTWELQRRRSVSPHDGLNANVQIQVKSDRVMRVLPLENDALNECWISDRDRFAYEGLYAADRLATPMVKRDGQWQAASWQDALNAAAGAIGLAVKKHGASRTAFLLGPHTTLEEASLARVLAAHVGGASIDHRLRVTDPELDRGGGLPWLGFKLSTIHEVDRFLVIGSALRGEQPLIAQRIRQRIKKGAALSVVGSIDQDLLCPVAAKAIVAPSAMLRTLHDIAAALAARLGKPARISSGAANADADAIAASLATGKRVAVLLGDMAMSRPDAAQIEAAAAVIAELCAGTHGRLLLAGGAAAGYVAGAVPSAGTLGAHAALGADGAKAFVLVGCEPERDSSRGAEALTALAQAEQVVCLTTFASDTMKQYASVLLPIAPFTETSGTYVALDGTVQSFTGVVRPLGETRPGWKVLRVLGDLLDADMSAFNSSEDVRRAALADFDEAQLGANVAAPSALAAAERAAGLERVATVPVYHADPLVRRAPSLAQTRLGRQARLRIAPATAAALALTDGARVRIKAGVTHTETTVALDPAVAPGCVAIALATEVSAALGDANAPVTLEAL